MPSKLAALSDLVSVKTGLPLSRAKRGVKAEDATRTRVLTPSSVSDGRICDERLPSEVISRANEELFAKEGDIVLKASTPYDCAYVDAHQEGLLVTSHFLILRQLEGSPVNMRYLAAYLSLTQTRRALQDASKGAKIQLLKKRDLEKLPVPLPRREEQDRLATLFESTQRQRELCRLIAEKSGLLLESSFDKALSGSKL